MKKEIKKEEKKEEKKERERKLSSADVQKTTEEKEKEKKGNTCHHCNNRLYQKINDHRDLSVKILQVQYLPNRAVHAIINRHLSIVGTRRKREKRKKRRIKKKRYIVYDNSLIFV